MAKIMPVCVRIVERKTIVYKTLVDPTVVKVTGEKMKDKLFVRLGFLKPKPEEVQYVSACMHACASEEEPDKILAEFGEMMGKLEVPAYMEVGVIRSKIVRRPSDIERVIEELFEVSERAIIYTPIYEVSFQNTRTSEVKALKIDGVTAEVVS